MFHQNFLHENFWFKTIPEKMIFATKEFSTNNFWCKRIPEEMILQP